MRKRSTLDPAKWERLRARYWAIRDEHASGYARPILWHLALRGDTMAMCELASTFGSSGRIADGFSQSGLCYRAYRRGDGTGAQHLAMTAFNRGDLTGYRYWIIRAGAGDYEAAQQAKRFETRLPHVNAAKVHRRRPYRADE